MRLFLFTIMLISLTLLGCGEKSDNSGKFTSTIYMDPGASLSTHTQSLSIDAKTPEGVGTLLALEEGMYNEGKISLCTWFLVGKNLAMTNSHCIPDAIKKDSKLSCGDYLQGGFQTKSGMTKVRCKKLIHASNISQLTILDDDYALLELEENIENAFTFKLDRKGIAENEKIKILTMTHYQFSTGIISKFKEHHCIMKSSDVFGKINSSGESPLAGFKEEGTTDLCSTVQGNSGSPVIDESSRLVGILHGLIKKNIGVNKDIKTKLSKLTNELSILTNLRCQKFNDLILDADYPEECAGEKKISQFDQEKLLTELEPKIIKHLEDTLAKQPTYFEYIMDLKSQGSGKIVSIRPKCIKSLNQWDEKSLKELELQGIRSKKKKITSFVGQYLMEFMIFLDYYGNYTMDINLLDAGNIQFNISGLNELDNKKQASSVMTTSLLNYKNPQEIKIPKCDQIAMKVKVVE